MSASSQNVGTSIMNRPRTDRLLRRHDQGLYGNLFKKRTDAEEKQFEVNKNSYRGILSAMHNEGALVDQVLEMSLSDSKFLGRLNRNKRNWKRRMTSKAYANATATTADMVRKHIRYHQNKVNTQWVQTLAYSNGGKGMYLKNEKGDILYFPTGVVTKGWFKDMYDFVQYMVRPDGTQKAPPDGLVRLFEDRYTGKKGWKLENGKLVLYGGWGELPDGEEGVSMDDSRATLLEFMMNSQIVTLHYQTLNRAARDKLVRRSRHINSRTIRRQQELQGLAGKQHEMTEYEIHDFLEQQSFAVARLGQQCIFTPILKDLEKRFKEKESAGKKKDKHLSSIYNAIKKKGLHLKKGGWTKKELTPVIKDISMKIVVHDVCRNQHIDICGKVRKEKRKSGEEYDTYRMTYHFYNTMKDHVEFIGTGNEREMRKSITLPRNEFESALTLSIQSGNINTVYLPSRVIKNINADITGFSVSNFCYNRADLVDHNRWMDELLKAKYEILSQTRILTGTDMYAAVRQASMNQPPRVVMDGEYLVNAEKIYQTDMSKCYLQYKKSRYYNGFCRVPNKHLEYEIEDHDLPGFYNIRVHTDFRLHGMKVFQNGWYPEPYLRFMDDHNISYTIDEAYVSTQDTLDLDIGSMFKPDNKMYCHMIGMLASDGASTKKYIIKDADKFPFPHAQAHPIKYGGIDCHLMIHRPRMTSYGINARHISAYIYCYANLNIWQRAMMVPTDNMIGLYVDAIITKEPIELPDCKPPQDFPVEKMKDGSFFKTEAIYTQGGHDEYNVSRALYDQKKITDDEMPNTQVVIMNGRGGTGKTSTVDAEGLGAYYCTVTHELLMDMRKSKGFITQVRHICRKGADMRRLTSAFLAKNVQYIEQMHLLVLDELTLFTMDDFKAIVDKALDCKVRLILCMDKGQLESEEDLCNSMIKYLSDKTNDIAYMTTKTDYRSTDDEIKKLKVRLHKMAIERATPSKVNKVLKEYWEDIRELKDEDLKDEDTIVMSLRGAKHLPEDYGSLYDEKRHMSVHSMQGKTIEADKVAMFEMIDMHNGSSWANIYAQYIYTAVSRCKSMLSLCPYMKKKEEEECDYIEDEGDLGDQYEQLKQEMGEAEFNRMMGIQSSPLDRYKAIAEAIGQEKLDHVLEGLDRQQMSAMLIEIEKMLQ